MNPDRHDDIGGTIIACSAFPAWYRPRIANLRSGGGVAEAEARLENRLAESERRQFERLERLEQAHAAQIADLDERADFAERLLAKGRES